MSHAELCPVCGGRGSVRGELIKEGFYKNKECHGCQGLGWVTIYD